MTGKGVTESVVEQAALAWPDSVRWTIADGPDIAPEMSAAARMNCDEVFQERWSWVR